MTDPALSLLSRGCGRFVSSNRDSYGFDGRLEVCFTPQDYFIWRSHDSLLRLSKSGHLLAEVESTLPKTFSTRRGPLLLYSQDLITVEAGCDSDMRRRRKHAVQGNKQEVEEQLSMLKELTAAILNYSTNKFIFSRLGPPFCPSLHLSYDPDPPQTSSLPVLTTPEPFKPHLHEQLGSWWSSGPLPGDGNTSQLKNQPEDPQTNFSAEGEEDDGSRKRVRLDLFLQIPCTSRTPTPQRESEPWVHYIAMTPEKPAEPQHPRGPQFTETQPPGPKEELRHLSCDGDVPAGPRSETSADQNHSERSMSRSRCVRREELSGAKHESNPEPQTKSAPGLFPPLTHGQSGCDEACWEKTDRQRWASSSYHERQPQLFPPIVESRTGTQVQTLQDAADNLTLLHQQPLLLPKLLPERFRRSGAKGEATQRQNLKKVGGGGRRPSEKGFISLDPGAGHKGPVKQTSSAPLQNQILPLKDPKEPGTEDKRVIRGVLPLELRDLQSDKPLGCLIVGPDGEILRVSLNDSSQDIADSGSKTRNCALQVLSPEGEKLPWLIMLQPEHTHTGRELEQSSDVTVDEIQLHQSSHQLMDLQGQPNASSPSSSTDAGIRKQTQNSEAEDAWRSEKKEAQEKNVWVPPLKETWREEQRGGDAEEEEERLKDAEQITHLFETTQTGQRSQNHFKATTEEAPDRKRRETKADGPEEAVKREREVETEKGSGSDGKRMRKDERSLKEKRRRDAQPIRGQKKEKRSERDAAEVQDPSDLFTNVKEKMRGHEGKEKRDGRGDAVKRKPGSAGRRGELTNREGVNEDSEEQDELKINQEIKDESLNKSTKSLNPGSEPADSDPLHTSSDKLSSVQSVRSLRSTTAASILRSSRRSVASSCEGAGPANTMALTSSHGRLSSCSIVMVIEEQLMLNPVKPEASRPARSQKQEEVTALHVAQQAERRRQEMERKRREREEEERRQQEREQIEERMKSELQEERGRRAEKIRSRREAEEERGRKQEEEEQQKARQDQEQRERERRRQEEQKRQMERFQRMREEEEHRRRAEAERLRLQKECLQLEEERKKEEENRKLQEMDEPERTEYLQRKELEEERRKEEDEQKRREEEAAVQAAEEARLQAEQLNRQMTLYQQQLALRRGLVLEAASLKEFQRISRPWVYSYFTLLKFLGPKADKPVTKSSNL